MCFTRYVGLLVFIFTRAISGQINWKVCEFWIFSTSPKPFRMPANSVSLARSRKTIMLRRSSGIRQARNLNRLSKVQQFIYGWGWHIPHLVILSKMIYTGVICRLVLKLINKWYTSEHHMWRWDGIREQFTTSFIPSEVASSIKFLDIYFNKIYATALESISACPTCAKNFHACLLIS